MNLWYVLYIVPAIFTFLYLTFVLKTMVESGEDEVHPVDYILIPLFSILWFVYWGMAAYYAWKEDE